MDLVGDRRGQSIQIGAILLFAALIIAFASYQAFVVPNQNRGVEFNHNQQVQSDMQDLRNAIVSARGSGDSRSVSVQLGTSYPSRLVARNPSPPSGSLRTVGTTDERVAIEIDNAQAAGETGDFWNESRRYNTGGITYRPNYNVYTNSPTTIYEQTVLYNRFPSGNITLSNQSFIDGTDISLIVINGSVSASSTRATSVDVEAVSSSTQRVRLENDSTGPITVTFTSRRPGTYWDFLEASQSTVDSVTTVSSANGYYNVSVALDPDRTYSLQLTKVGVGSGVTKEDAAYLTYDPDLDGTKVTEDETTELTLEVRDRFNNPPENIAELTVNGSVVGSGNGKLDDSVRTPDEDGHVTFVYNATGATGKHEIQFSYTNSGTGLDTSTPQNASITVDVQSSNSGSVGSGGGGGAYSLSWADPSDYTTNEALADCSPTGCTWDVGASSDTVLTLRAETTPPLSGFDVEYAVNDTAIGTLATIDGETDSNGRNTTDFDASENGTVGVYTASGGASDLFNLTVENVTEGGSGGGGGGDAQRVNVSQIQINNGDIVVQFRNDNSDSITFAQARLDSYTDANPPGNPNKDPIDRVIYRPGVPGPALDVGDPLENVGGPTISNGGTQDVTFSPQSLQTSSGNYGEEDAETADTMTITIEFDDGSTRQYTINP